jgi:ABC-2 type transport system permease protein
VVSQMFFRGVYLFSNLIRNGEFDFLLSKPLSPLFRALTGRPDINDALFFPPTLAMSIWLMAGLNIEVTASSIFLYCLLLLNGFLIATALHIMVMCVGILTTEIDHTIWTYRDLIRLAEFPVSMYIQPVRLALFFLLPAGMMITIPSQVLINTEPSYPLVIVFTIGIAFFVSSLFLWQWSLKRYSSASS